MRALKENFLNPTVADGKRSENDQIVALEKHVLSAVHVLTKHQKSMQSIDFCRSLNLVCKIYYETTDVVQLEQNLKPCYNQIEEFLK